MKVKTLILMWGKENVPLVGTTETTEETLREEGFAGKHLGGTKQGTLIVAFSTGCSANCKGKQNLDFPVLASK